MTDADEILLGELRGAAATAAEPVPTVVVAAAMAAYTWRTVDAELALLAYDSADDVALAGVRGEGARLLSFSAVQVNLDVEVTTVDETRSLVGEVVPVPDRLQVQRPGGGIVDVGVDAEGRFRVESIEAGPARFRVVVPGRTLTTDWVSM